MARSGLTSRASCWRRPQSREKCCAVVRSRRYAPALPYDGHGPADPLTTRRSVHPSDAYRHKIQATGEPSMRIDAYTHFFPKPFFDRMMDIAGEYKDMGKRVRSL